MELLLLVLALALDYALGDPRGLPHPVRYIGKALEAEEGLLRRVGLAGTLGGALALLVNVVVVFGVVSLLTCIPLLGALIWLYLGYAGLALGQLLTDGRSVAERLDRGDLDGARGELALLVSRDVAGLDEQGLRRALAETLSENLNDGFVAPLFFLAVGGPAWMWSFKVVSTMDSMWGYRTAEYSALGWAAARADDILAWIPARLTALFLMAAGWWLGRDFQAASEHLAGDSAKTESPNAGWPMAAAAWLMGASMGGPAVYFGQPKDKPQLGPDGDWTADKLGGLLQLVVYGALVAAVVVCFYKYLISLI